MPTTYAHTNIVAKDWRVLARFYQSVFDCQPVPPERQLSGKWLSESTGVPDAELNGIHLRLPGFAEDGPTLEVFSYRESVEQSQPVANRRGFGHIAFQVDDVRAKLKELIESGGSTVGQVVTQEIPQAGTITFVYAADPEGNIVELQCWE